jgi:ABC-2 type transport system ATP-binding protein
MPAAIQVQALTRRFADLVAVERLSFEVESGGLFGLVGPDGAGKTTTLRMLAGVLPPSEGDALVEGVSVARDPEGVKPSIAYMSQRFGLYTDLTVRENIEFYADLYRVPAIERPARRNRLYAFSRLGPFEHRLAGQLSGGMKQKLALCCALIHHPRVLLLDEPTFGVDPLSRRDLWLILHRMVAEGVTVLVSTAYLDEAERCDRVALLHQGRLLALDRPAALQESLPWQMLEVQTPEARRAVKVLEAVPGIRRVSLFGDLLHVSVPDRERDWPRGEAALAAERIVVTSVRPLVPSLEDVFIEKVEGRGSRVEGDGPGSRLATRDS